MKKYLSIIFALLLLFILSYLIFSNYTLSKSNSNLIDEVDSIAKKVEEIDNKSTKDEGRDSESLRDKLKRVNKYAIEVRQIGGSGSRTTNVTIWNLEDQEYFSEKEGWALYSFNSPADLLYVSCREGYKASTCSYKESKFKVDINTQACVFPMAGNANQNVAYAECIKI